MDTKIWRTHVLAGFCAAAMFSVAWSGVACAGDLVIAPVNSIQQQMAVYENGQKLGQVGEPIKLDDGNHQLTVMGTDDYGVKMDVEVSAAVFQVDKTSYEVPSHVSQACDFSKARLAKPAVSKSSEGDTTKLELQGSQHLESVFAKELGCALYFRKAEMSVIGSCDANMIELDASSTPQGARILVDGQDKGPTNSDLSLTYCSGQEKSKHVEIKLAGQSLCKADLDLVPNKVYPLACKKP